jgi:hypothetical protein
LNWLPNSDNLGHEVWYYSVGPNNRSFGKLEVKRLQLVVVGTASASPYAGMAWMHMQIVVGLQRLGHDVYYMEAASSWPYDPIRETSVGDFDYALPYLQRLARYFGMNGRWAYRRSYGDKEWFGLSRAKAEELLLYCDAVINVSGATCLKHEGLKVGRLVYLGTDPVEHEVGCYNNDKRYLWILDEHDVFATYGENIGTNHSPIPPLPRLRARTRQPVLVDLWKADAPRGCEFTTVCNWKSAGEIEFKGERYYWSKDREFMKFVDLPRNLNQTVELAVGRSGLSREIIDMLTLKGWRLTDAQSITLDPWPYRDYVRASKGEFTVAKDQNVRLRSGWFSERSACYLAAGRPVITQDTGFGTVLPTGEGLFAFETMDEIVAAFDTIRSDYRRHSRAARAIAEEYFRAETVLTKLLRDLGL